MFYASFGSFMHKILEKYYKGELTRSELPIYFLSNYKTEVEGARPDEKITRSYIANGLDYLKNFQPLPYRVLSIEKQYRFSVGDKKFVGFLDYVGEKDGEIIIVDNKSRKLKPRSSRHKPTGKDKELDEMLGQLYLYSAAVEQEHGKLPAELCFNCFRNSEFITEKFDLARYIDALDWAKKAVNEIENAEEFEANIDYFKCKWLCGFHSICQYYLEDLNDRRW